MRLPKIACLFLIIFFITGCSKCNKNRQLPDTSHITVQPGFVDFNAALLTYDSAMFLKNFDGIKHKYYDIITGYISFMNDGMEVNDSIAALFYLRYRYDRDINQLYDSARKKVFPQLEKQKELITSAFKNYRYYFEKDTLPTVAFFISGFNYKTPLFIHTLAISLDFYLGKDFPYYPDFPQYIINRCEPSYIASDAVQAMLRYKTENLFNEERFIDRMVYEGKLLYLGDLILPEVSDSIRMGYSAAQLKWCFDNEKEMWQHMLDPKVKLLYSTNKEVNEKYFQEGPFTNAWQVPHESSPRFASWVGKRMVEAYMEKVPGTTPSQLLALPADEILKGSKYKPD